jgi:hypothetical protein
MKRTITVNSKKNFFIRGFYCYVQPLERLVVVYHQPFLHTSVIHLVVLCTSRYNSMPLMCAYSAEI